MIFVISYILGVILFNLWEAIIGFGIDFPKFRDGPNAAFCSIFWIGSLPLLMIINFLRLCAKLKAKRIDREDYKKRIRIAAKKEKAQFEAEVEQELLELNKNDRNNTTL